MSNHKWNKETNVCLHCGLKRERKDYSKVVLTFSRLGKDGCFYDVPVYQNGTAWWYGEVNKFERPDCNKIKPI